MDQTVSLHASASQVPIEVETKYELTRLEQEAFLSKLTDELHFPIVLEGIVTDSFTQIEESKVTQGKDFERYRHVRYEAQGKEQVEIVKNRKWWEVDTEGRDIRRETPDLPVSLEEYASIEPNILVSLIKKRISLAGMFNDKDIHVDLDMLYDYAPADLPADITDIPEEKIRYFIEAERVIFNREEFGAAKADVAAFLKEQFGKEGKEAQGMLSMAIERMARQEK